MKLTAIKSVKYDKKTYAKGESFEVPDRWGRVLVLIGRAKKAEGGDEFGIAKTPAAKPASPDKMTAAKRAQIEKAAKPTAAQLTEFQRSYKTRDMGAQPPSAPAAEPVKVEDFDAKEVVKPHEKPAE